MSVCVREGGDVSVTFGEIEFRDWTEMGEGLGVKTQNGVKVHNVTVARPHPQTPISRCKYTHCDPHPDHPYTHTVILYGFIAVRKYR